MRLGRILVLELDLQLEIAGSIPATALLSATFGMLFTYICLCHQPV